MTAFAPFSHVRRPVCAACARAASTCICGWVRPVENEVELLILQHPDEARQTKGTARLLDLSLARSQLVAAERFDDSLQTLLDEGARIPVLLYPDTPGGLLPAPPELLAMPQPARLRLVVLDATWGKSLKMLLLNPRLQALPRFALDGSQPSAYRIRKAPRAGQLSTLEAACHALARLENAHQRYAPLLESFAGFVDELAARVPQR